MSSSSVCSLYTVWRPVVRARLSCTLQPAPQQLHTSEVGSHTAQHQAVAASSSLSCISSIWYVGHNTVAQCTVIYAQQWGRPCAYDVCFILCYFCGRIGRTKVCSVYQLQHNISRQLTAASLCLEPGPVSVPQQLRHHSHSHRYIPLSTVT